MDIVELLDNVTEWAETKVAGVDDEHLGSPTPCDEWNVRDLINHMVGVLRRFEAATRGEQLAPPTTPPPDVIGDEPAAVYAEARRATVAAYSAPGAAEQTVTAGKEMPRLGIAIADQLVHGWDLAKATDQDAMMPSDLAEKTWQLLNGFVPDAVRGEGKIFREPVAVPDDANAQDKLIAYCGRTP